MASVVDHEFAPRSFEPGYILLSYLVSFVGSLSTLELLQLRTSGRGAYNWYLLIGSSVTMGGIAIWSMHFIGNRAIVLYDGQENLQLSYNPGYTAGSFFVPVLVLLGAYWITGSIDETRYLELRIGISGPIAGLSICGMHYLGDSGIANYKPVYNPGHVAGSIVIAVVATSAALTLFFLLRKNFTNQWWKRMGMAVILAGGVSGMHWTASVGTRHLYKPGSGLRSAVNREVVATITIVLSVVTCFGLLAFAAFSGRKVTAARHRAQKVVLAFATFSEDGKLMVLPEGSLPSKTITDTLLERSFDEHFGNRHTVFHWLYRTSRNWKGVVDLLPGMLVHTRDQSSSVSADFAEEYSLVFRELFCLAAKDLAEATHQPLEDVGVLHEEILTAGCQNTNLKDPENGNIQNRGNGKVLFLVKRVDKKEVARLTTYGFRFAALSAIVPVLSSSMQASQDCLNSMISTMYKYSTSENQRTLEAGVHLGCFSLRADIKGGFDILVKRNATHQIPTVLLQSSWLYETDLALLQKHSGKTVSAVLTALSTASTNSFASHFHKKLLALKNLVPDTFFMQAILDTTLLQIGSEDSSPTTLIVFKGLAPIHSSTAKSSDLVFSPFPFFVTQQRTQPNSPHHIQHARAVHREFSGLAPKTKPRSFLHKRSILRQGRLGSISTGSEKNLVDPLHPVLDGSAFTSAGIMVSQSVSVETEMKEFHEVDANDLGPSVHVQRDDEDEGLVWCEELLRGFAQVRSNSTSG